MCVGEIQSQLDSPDAKALMTNPTYIALYAQDQSDAASQGQVLKATGAAAIWSGVVKMISVQISSKSALAPDSDYQVVGTISGQILQNSTGDLETVAIENTVGLGAFQGAAPGI